MFNTIKSVLWWIFAILFTLVIAVYQKMTGPTYPVRGSVTLNNQLIKYKLPRSANNDEDAVISIPVNDTAITGAIRYKRFKSNDEWIRSALTRQAGKLEYRIPKQPAAGKVMYEIILSDGPRQEILANKGEPVVMRFKGPVPLFILIPHILLMFLAMLFSTRTGIEALRKGSKTYAYAICTLIFLIPGGLILGPVVQKYAFGAFWTGWPFGHDLTDNKTVIAFIVWLIAVIKLRKNRQATGWAIAASVILLAVYLIPHSVLGSEIDYTQVPGK
jgi:hypothetical protein